jgi:hypothetical protein
MWSTEFITRKISRRLVVLEKAELPNHLVIWVRVCFILNARMTVLMYALDCAAFWLCCLSWEELMPVTPADAVDVSAKDEAVCGFSTG